MPSPHSCPTSSSPIRSRRWTISPCTGRSATRLQRSVLYLIWKDPWMTVSRDTYISRTLGLFGLQTLPDDKEARYPELASLELDGVELVLLPTEPYRFKEGHRAELQARLKKPVYLVDGEMTSWYGPRAIACLGYLADFSSSL